MKLFNLIEALKKNRKDNINYAIPDLWFLEDYNIDFKRIKNKEILVNPYDFYLAVINEYILKNYKDGIDYSKNLSETLNIDSTNGDWVKKSVIYSMMIRTSTSYDHDRSESLDLYNISGLKETGSFVKTLALLPLLKRLGVNVLYLLPISKYSLENKKGELGSPYGVESFYKLDPLLKDDLTGDLLTIEDEFQALVEACHIMGIRVTIDVIPRTASVCSELIIKHPEWFYWINDSDYQNYKAPQIEGFNPVTYPSFDCMEKVYDSIDTKNHILMFRKNPKDQDKELFKTIKGNNSSEVLSDIKNKYGLRIAPAFSDNINDPQPPWSDITFFRMFLDDPILTSKYVDYSHNPYILFDTIKSNLYPGKKPNKVLWNELSNIIPYYQKNFGIDGARIDMGHALPSDLLKMIISNAKEIDNDFLFIAEELNMDNDKKAKENGYNAMIGNGFWALPRINEGYSKYFIEHMIEKSIPSFACFETHDTRRIAFRYGNEKMARFSTILEYFIPNTIPFINSGQEFYEKEPMNLGLDSDSSDLEALSKDDIFYQKLALFDKYELHYRNENNMEIIDHLKDVLITRDRWIDTIINLDSYLKIDFNINRNSLIGISYINKETHKCLIILANGDMNEGINITASLKELREKSFNDSRIAKLLYATYEMPRDFYDFNYDGDLTCYMGSGEVKIFEI